MYCPNCGAPNQDDAKYCQSCGGAMDLSSSPTPPPPPTPPSSPSPKPPTVSQSLGEWISKGFSEALSDIGAYFLLGLVVGVVSAVTAGILAGPLIAGSLVVIRRKIRGEGRIEIGDVFNEGFKYFVPSFLFVFLSILAMAVIMGLLSTLHIVGWLASILLGGVFFVFWGLGLHYITEHNMDFWPAAQAAIDVVVKDLLNLCLFGILASIIAEAGVIACGIGVFFTSAASLCMLAFMLEDMFGKK